MLLMKNMIPNQLVTDLCNKAVFYCKWALMAWTRASYRGRIVAKVATPQSGIDDSVPGSCPVQVTPFRASALPKLPSVPPSVS